MRRGPRPLRAGGATYTPCRRVPGHLRTARARRAQRVALSRLERADGAVERGARLGRPADAGLGLRCASTGCRKPVRLTIAEYEAVRASSTRFFVLPAEEHLSPAVERVVERYDRYWVVEKIGEAAEVSEELDPRGA
jgi:hypothetical protein